MERDVAMLIARLRSIIHSAEQLAANAEDLHALAYDRAVTDTVKSGGDGSELDPLTGDAGARHVWGRMSARVREAEARLAGHAGDVLNLLNVGNQRPELFGTHLSAADYARALKAQRRRDERGEYTPARNLPQPRYPGKQPKEKPGQLRAQPRYPGQQPKEEKRP